MAHTILPEGAALSAISSGIYRIHNIVNSRVYVGSAVNIPERWRAHRERLSKGTHKSPRLQSAWNKYGEPAFEFQFIEAVEPTKEALLSREQVHLDAAFAAGLAYNTCRTAGSVLGLRHTDATRAKMSTSQAERIFTTEHRANLAAASLGKKHSVISRAKMSAWQVGKKLTDEHRAKVSAKLMGRECTEATRAKLSASRTGQKASAETCGRISASKIGRKLSETALASRIGRKASDETRAKMSVAHTGKKRTEETRTKIRLASLKREAAKRERLS
jgi:group I intron endonuclease